MASPLSRNLMGDEAFHPAHMGLRVILTAGALVVATSVAPAQSIDLSNIDAGIGGFVINGQAASDYSGWSVSSAGDVNGDGLADVIMGARGSDPPAGADAGRSYVVFGKTGGADVDLSVVATGASALGFVINGQAGSDRSGISVSSAGDVNGDGLADVIVGAYRSNPATGIWAGRSYVVFGKTGGAAVDLSAVATDTSALGFVINGQASEDFSGFSVCSAGDANGDGLADVIVGAQDSDPAVGPNAGRSYVVFGKPDGAGVDLSAVATGTSALGFVINGQATFDQSGVSVSSAGDVNGDGLADVIVGANTSDPAAGIDAGCSYVVFGKTGGAAVDLSAVATGSSALGFVINGQAVSDRSGSSVSSAGDVNGDGLADVIVGALVSDPAAGPNAGRTYVVFGKPDGAGVDLSAVATGTSALGFVINGQAAGDRSGISVSPAGDVNGDGLADVIMGAEYSDPATGLDAGRSYVVFGKPGGAAVNLAAVATGTSALGFVINGQAAGDRSGFSVSPAGDVNGDGLADVIVGASFSNPAAGTDAGRTYVIFSPYGAAPQTPEIAGRYTAVVGAGNANRQGIGTNRFGDDRTVFADSRLSIDFDAGTAAPTTVTLTRDNGSLSGLAAAGIADSFWHVASARTGWTNAVVTVRYTDAEIAGLSEGALKLYRSATKFGPWTQVSTTIDATRNEASGTLTSLPAFLAIAQPDTIPPQFFFSLSNSNPTSAEALTFFVSFTESVAPTFTIADVSLTGTLAGTSSVVSVTPDDTGLLYFVSVQAAPANADGTLGIALDLGGISDAGGNLASATPTSPLYTIINTTYPAGDIDKNGVVNVADVTLLGNFIVNGAPLP